MQAEIIKSCQEICCLEIFIDDMKDVDIPPLLDVCLALNTSEIEAVDLCNESTSELNGGHALSLMRAIDQKLRVVDLKDLSFVKDFLWYIMVDGASIIYNIICDMVLYLFIDTPILFESHLLCMFKTVKINNTGVYKFFVLSL